MKMQFDFCPLLSVAFICATLSPLVSKAPTHKHSFISHVEDENDPAAKFAAWPFLARIVMGRSPGPVLGAWQKVFHALLRNKVTCVQIIFPTIGTVNRIHSLQFHWRQQAQML